ncbi:phosphodiester glycosidase family protein [bacterium]|nr:phosphodiester glycosidase family protein [bacterium]
MNIEILKIQLLKMHCFAVKFFIFGCIIVLTCSIFKIQPIIANETIIARGNVVTPILQKETISNDIKRVTADEQSQEFDNSIKKRYPNSLIYTIAPGIKHIKIKKICQGRPVLINVVEINTKLNSNIKINPQLASNNKLTSKSTITNIANRNNSIIAINGTYFKPQTGVPLGTLMINKKLYTGPIYNRVAMGFFDNGYDMARLELNASIKFKNNSIKVDNINQPRMLSTYVLVYTSDWGTNSPATPKYGIQIAVKDDKIVGISTQSMQIPEGGYVIIGPKQKLEILEKYKKITLDIKTIPEWDNVNHIISGGPYLVKNGEIYIDVNEQKLQAIGGKNPRTAIGYTKDNNLIMITVDGREGASVGMTLNELAIYMKSIGCINAMNLDGGGSSVMYVSGKVTNRPKVKGGIALSNALTVNLKS